MKKVYQLLLVALFLAALSGALVLLVRQISRPGVEVLLPTATPSPELKVYISGAVVNPGVYTLEEGDRLEDALEAAGGEGEDADLSQVNLAQRVRDQDHFHIPRLGEVLASPTGEPRGGRINVNTASVELLQTLPQIGPVRAQAIVDYRERHGPFSSVEELLQVEGIGPATYQQIRDLVTIGSP